MQKLILLTFLTGIYLVWLFPGSIIAQDYCFEEAGRLYNISPEILWAISKQESAFDPYAINFNSNGTYDYGHMQINSSWADKIGLHVWASLGDPCQSTKVGAWILSQCISEHGYTWKAIGCYHANSKGQRIQYAWKIHNAVKKLQ